MESSESILGGDLQPEKPMQTARLKTVKIMRFMMTSCCFRR